MSLTNWAKLSEVSADIAAAIAAFIFITLAIIITRKKKI